MPDKNLKKTKKYRTYMAKADEVQSKWYVVDADGLILGRLAVEIAMRLMGKDKPTYTPHIDTGDFVIVINAAKVAIHPKKQQAQTYRHWSGYLGGLRTETFAKVMSKDPRKPIIEAVRRMLPKNLLAKHMLSKLKVYVDDKHPHVAQNPEVWRPLGKREAV